MRVLLLKDLKKYGKKGDVVDITDGYVNNYLLPNNFVKLATPQAISQAIAQKKQVVKVKAEKKSYWLEVKDKLEAVTLEFKLKANKMQVFGSITIKDIINSLLTNYDIELNKKQFINFQNIHTLGLNKVSLKLNEDVLLILKVEVGAFN